MTVRRFVGELEIVHDVLTVEKITEVFEHGHLVTNRADACLY